MATENNAPTCLALIAPGVPTASDAAALIRQRLGANLLRPGLEVEIIPGLKESLILVHPPRGEKIYISAAAAAFLAGYFDREGY